MDEHAVKEYLRDNREDFRELFEKHQVYESELNQLTHRPYLSAQEQFRQTELKKKKLALKDQMQLMINDYLSQAVAN